MNSGKGISNWWNNMLCYFLGHTPTAVCNRCGKFVDLAGTKRLTLEERINAWWKNRKNVTTGPKYKGSLKLVPGLKKYSINIKTNELKEVVYTENTEVVRDKYGFRKWKKNGDSQTKVVTRKAEYEPFCVYIDAMNDETAVRKANNYMYTIKSGVRITAVTKATV